jgi:diguanylate cyclase (GGDEF)-like protein/PAS domain S-box-containing protein
MLIFEMRTLLFTLFLVNALCSFLLFVLYAQNRNRFAGIGYWGIDFLLRAAPLPLIILRGAIPTFLSVVVPNTMILGGALCSYAGTSAFTGRRPRVGRNLLLIAAFAAFYTYLVETAAPTEARSLTFTSAWLLIALQSALVAFRGQAGTAGKLVRRIGFVYAALSAVNIVRIGKYLFAPTGLDYLAGDAFESMILLTYLLLSVLYTFSLTLAVNGRLAEEVANREALFYKAFNSAPYGLALTSFPDGTIVEANDRFLKIFGYSLSEVVGRNATELGLWMRQEDRAKVVAEVGENLSVSDRELRYRTRSGEVRTALFSAEALTINGKRLMLSTVNDITERKAMEERIREVSIRDPLTNVFNRRYMFERFEELIAERARIGTVFAFAIIDLDHFKSINDTYGHQAGDTLLVELTRLIQSSTRPYDLVGRYGGEEFIILSAHCTKDQASTLIARTLEVVRSRGFQIGEKRIDCTFSAGIADSRDFPDGEVTAERMLRLADERLYRAKDAGRNRLVSVD